LVVFALDVRKTPNIKSLLVYTCNLVAASQAIANQYLAIVLPFVVSNLNPFALMYAIVATGHLLVGSSGLHLSVLGGLPEYSRSAYYAVLVLPLVAAFVWAS